MEHKVLALNWDGERIELTVECGGDTRRVAAAAHREIKKLDERYVIRLGEGHGKEQVLRQLQPDAER